MQGEPREEKKKKRSNPSWEPIFQSNDNMFLDIVSQKDILSHYLANVGKLKYQSLSSTRNVKRQWARHVGVYPWGHFVSHHQPFNNSQKWLLLSNMTSLYVYA